MKPATRTTIPACPACGWEGRMTSPATAAHALRLHSCDTHRARQARAGRAAARRAASGPEAPCRHDGRHPHGDRLRYVVDLCRCRACRDAAAAYERARTKAQAYGRWEPYVDADPVRAHVDGLRAKGMGPRRIAEAAGISNGCMTRLLWGSATRPRSRRVTAATARRLLAVTFEPRPDARVPATGTIRRLRALVAIGWTQAELARRMGWTLQNLNQLLRVGRPAVAARTATAAAALFDELHMTLGPSPRARAIARARGWAPPLAWDDIDDPRERRRPRKAGMAA